MKHLQYQKQKMATLEDLSVTIVKTMVLLKTDQEKELIQKGKKLLEITEGVS